MAIHEGADLRQLVSMLFAPIGGAIAGGAGGAFGSVLNAPNFLAQQGATTATGAQNRQGRGQGIKNLLNFFPYLAGNVGEGVYQGTLQNLDTVTSPNYDPSDAMRQFFKMLYGRGN